MTQEAIQEIIRKQRNYFYTGATLNIDFRSTALKKLQTSIQSHQEQINAALKSDLGKSSFESYMCESGLVLSEITYMLKHIRSLSREKTVHTPLAQFHSRSYRKPSPYGVTLIMSPWNYPFLLTFDPLVDAIAAGNTAVLKPSAYSPATSNIICEIVRECFPEEYVAVVMGGRQENSCLLQEHFDYIFFTGSQAVGKEVMRHASEHLTPVTLELGGKSPCIVDKDADIRCAAKRIAWGKCLNAGQTCIAPDYLLVHTRVKSELLEKLIYYIRQFYGEQPEKSPDYPRIVRQEAVTRLERLMPKEKIVYGGKVIPEEKFIAPTILDRVSPQDAVMQEEIFGPLLPVIEFYDLEEAIGYINAREKPLALYYFGTTASAKKVIAKTSSGGVCINDTVMHIANGHLPFGGVGHSGMGRYHGFDSFAAFTNRRSVLISPTLWDIPLKYPPYRGFKLLKRFIK